MSTKASFRRGALYCALWLAAGCAAPSLPTAERLSPLIDGAPSLQEAARAASLGDPHVQGELEVLVEKLGTQPDWTDAYKRTLLLERALLLHEKYQTLPSATAHYEAGYSLERRNYAPEAYHQYAQAAERDPGEAKYHAALGRMALVDGKPEVALAHYADALERAPDKGGWLLEYGLCQYGLRDDAGALASYERARDLMPDYPPVYERLAVVRWRMGDLEQASDLLARCKALGGSPRADFEAKLAEDLGVSPGEMVSTTTPAS